MLLCSLSFGFQSLVAGLILLCHGALSFEFNFASIGKFLIPCKYQECCGKPPWYRDTRDSLVRLSRTFKEEVFGQHIAEEHVKKWLFAHLKNPNPSKALVMSFHGWTGNGKNLVARIIAESMYEKGLKSDYVHYFFTTLHFPKENKVDIYKLHVQDWIRGNVSQCNKSLFIFDEVDKMPTGLLDAIKPFVDYHEEIDGVDHRQSVYIFLSNTGGKKLTQKSVELWEDGNQRSDMTYQDFEKLMQVGAFNEKGGLFRGDLIDRSLIDLYVPFLPLEKMHVRQCAEADFKRRGFNATPKEIDDIASTFQYWPADTQLYSTTGCKRVSQLVSVKLQEREIEMLFADDNLKNGVQPAQPEANSKATPRPPAPGGITDSSSTSQNDFPPTNRDIPPHSTPGTGTASSPTDPTASRWGWKRLAIIGGTTAAVAGASVVAAPLVIGAAGFSASGIAAGTMAAAWQASIGNVAVGSLFAALQSAGVLGLGAGVTTAVAATAAATGAAAVAAGTYLSDKYGQAGKENEQRSQMEDPKPEVPKPKL